MKPSCPTTPQQIAIALPRPGKDYREPATVLSHVLGEQGHRVDLTVDGDPAIMAADVLILFGRFTAFAASRERLLAAPSQRPTTIIWHIENLPPTAIPSQALPSAHRLARCHWNRLPRPLVKLSSTLPGRRHLYHAAQGILVRRLGQQLDLTPELRASLGPDPWHHAVRHYLWMREHYSPQWCDCVAASTPQRCEVLNAAGIESHYAPLGYHPDWGQDRGQDRDIEVLFLGHHRKNMRGRLLKHLRRQLEPEGVTLTVVDRDCFGEDRIALLNRTRIFLDLNKSVWEMPLMRLMMGMACGAMVVSNWRGDPFPFTDEHLVRVPTEDLARTLIYYLRHDTERTTLAASGHRYVMDKLAWGPVVSRLVQTALAHRSQKIGVSS